MHTFAALLLFLLLTPAWAAQPRIVSINPCVDAVLVRVADAEQIGGISHYSQDPQSASMPLEIANRFHATSGTAEEVVALSPDFVMTGPHVSPATILALEKLKIQLVKQKVAEHVEQSYEQIRQIAEIAGHPERGEALIAEIERAVEAARPKNSRRVGALIWQGGGIVPGGGSLADELLMKTGFRNLSVEYGLKKWDVLPLEYLVASPPDVLLSIGGGEAGRDRMMDHPAVRRLADHGMLFRRYPFRLLGCAGPSISEAVTRLAEIRREPVVEALAR